MGRIALASESSRTTGPFRRAASAIGQPVAPDRAVTSQASSTCRVRSTRSPTITLTASDRSPLTSPLAPADTALALRTVTAPDDDDAPFVVLEGADTDDPPAPADDFSGEEPFWARGSSLDACGEPLHVFPGSTIRDGELSSPSATGTLASLH